MKTLLFALMLAVSSCALAYDDWQDVQDHRDYQQQQRLERLYWQSESDANQRDEYEDRRDRINQQWQDSQERARCMTYLDC